MVTTVLTDSSVGGWLQQAFEEQQVAVGKAHLRAAVPGNLSILEEQEEKTTTMYFCIRYYECRGWIIGGSMENRKEHEIETGTM